MESLAVCYRQCDNSMVIGGHVVQHNPCKHGSAVEICRMDNATASAADLPKHWNLQWQEGINKWINWQSGVVIIWDPCHYWELFGCSGSLSGLSLSSHFSQSFSGQPLLSISVGPGLGKAMKLSCRGDDPLAIIIVGF